MKYTSLIPSWNVDKKCVIVRVDFNVPILNGAIKDDFRIRAALPTIDALLNAGATVIILTHIGRPKNKNPDLSTTCIVRWFKKNDYDAYFADTIEKAQALEKQHSNSIIVLENLRFFPEEKMGSMEFAQSLAQLGEFYVDDAFGDMHRNDTSITFLPKQFPHDKRSIGLLTQEELAFFNSILHHPQKPFTVVLGGGKVSDKLPLITHLISKANTILLCPAISFTFAKAMGKPVGKSLVDETLITQCSLILEQAKKHGTRIVLPEDYQVAHESLQGTLSYTESDKIADSDYGISIGKKTIKTYSSIIKESGTIFFNGSMGFADRPETMIATNKLLKAIAQARGVSVVAGGDSVAAAQANGSAGGFNFVSTGGGAALEYLCNATLPGLEALLSDVTN
jgi:phosphoglycerate kinase